MSMLIARLDSCCYHSLQVGGAGVDAMVVGVAGAGAEVRFREHLCLFFHTISCPIITIPRYY